MDKWCIGKVIWFLTIWGSVALMYICQLGSPDKGRHGRLYNKFRVEASPLWDRLKNWRLKLASCAQIALCSFVTWDHTKYVGCPSWLVQGAVLWWNNCAALFESTCWSGSRSDPDSMWSLKDYVSASKHNDTPKIMMVFLSSSCKHIVVAYHWWKYSLNRLQ